MPLTLPGIVEAGSDRCDFVLTAVDSHPRYLRFVNDWIESWRIFGRTMRREVNPIVVLVDCDESVVERSNRRFVTRLTSPFGLHSALVAQVVRLFAPGRIEVGSSVVVTSDVDMFPVGTGYFDHVFRRAAQHFVVARDVLSHRNEFPMCYLGARSIEWNEVFCAGSSIEDDLLQFAHLAYSGEHGGAGWNTDQLIAFEKLAQWPGLVRLNDTETGHRRLDRGDSLLSILVNSRKSALSDHSDYHAHVDPPSGRLVSSMLIRRLRRLHLGALG